MTHPPDAGKADLVRLPYGGLTRLARLLDVTPSHLSHCLRAAGARQSRALDARLQAQFGVRLAQLVASSSRADAEGARVLELPPDPEGAVPRRRRRAVRRPARAPKVTP